MVSLLYLQLLQQLILHQQDQLITTMLNNIGATFMFYIDTAATDVQIITDGTDKFTGAAMIAVDDGAKKAFFPGAANDVLSMNGTTTGGIVGSVITVTALESAQYLVHNTLILGSGTIVTPFSDT
jgi:hypothetical protein